MRADVHDANIKRMSGDADPALVSATLIGEVDGRYPANAYLSATFTDSP